MLGFKKQVLIIVIFLLITRTLLAWERNYGTEYDDYGQSVCENIYTNGGFVIGGTTVYSENDFDAYLIVLTKMVVWDGLITMELLTVLK